MLRCSTLLLFLVSKHEMLTRRLFSFSHQVTTEKRLEMSVVVYVHISVHTSVCMDERPLKFFIVYWLLLLLLLSYALGAITGQPGNGIIVCRV